MSALPNGVPNGGPVQPPTAPTFTNQAGPANQGLQPPPPAPLVPPNRHIIHVPGTITTFSTITSVKGESVAEQKQTVLNGAVRILRHLNPQLYDKQDRKYELVLLAQTSRGPFRQAVFSDGELLMQGPAGVTEGDAYVGIVNAIYQKTAELFPHAWAEEAQAEFVAQARWPSLVQRETTATGSSRGEVEAHSGVQAQAQEEDQDVKEGVWRRLTRVVALRVWHDRVL